MHIFDMDRLFVHISVTVTCVSFKIFFCHKFLGTKTYHCVNLVNKSKYNPVVPLVQCFSTCGSEGFVEGSAGDAGDAGVERTNSVKSMTIKNINQEILPKGYTHKQV